jgi:hypothetical protein
MISTRFAGLDGVSLEAAKLAPVIEAAGHEIAWFAGELGEGFTPGLQAPGVHFDGPSNAALQTRAFGSAVPDTDLEAEIHSRASELKPDVLRFLREFEIDVAYVHNVLSIPMQLPFAVALAGALVETGIRAVAHHHDFAWEKPRFDQCAVPEIVSAFFPPDIAGMRHLVINSVAQRSLGKRTGIEATLLPNVLDFNRGPRWACDGRRYRETAGIAEDATVLLQPTRIIDRKGIEATIHLAAELGPTAVVAFSHDADRDGDYWRMLQSLAGDLQVEIVFSPVAPDEARGSPWLGDAFAAADIVCFPSIQEGFGNALVEALFFKRPLFVRRYEVYVADIAPMGVRAVEMDDEVTDAVVAAVKDLIASPEKVEEMVLHNYEVGGEHMSYGVARERLIPLLEGRPREESNLRHPV